MDKRCGWPCWRADGGGRPEPPIRLAGTRSRLPPARQTLSIAPELLNLVLVDLGDADVALSVHGHSCDLALSRKNLLPGAGAWSRGSRRRLRPTGRRPARLQASATDSSRLVWLGRSGLSSLGPSTCL